LGLKLDGNYDRLCGVRQTKLNLLLPLLLTVGILGGCTNSSRGTQNPIGITPPPSVPTEAITLSPEPTKQVLGSESANMETLPTTVTAVITTNRGVMTLKLYPDSTPNTVKNFVAKAKAGDYNGLTIHRVEDWVIQGGDPKGDGTGGGDQPTELSQVPFKIGSLGVARAGDIKVSNDSQFFITKKDSSFLNGEYTYFGKVISGMDVVNSLAVGDSILSTAILSK